jgi:hypothetical protein
VSSLMRGGRRAAVATAGHAGHGTAVLCVAAWPRPAPAASSASRAAWARAAPAGRGWLLPGAMAACGLANSECLNDASSTINSYNGLRSMMPALDRPPAAAAGWPAACLAAPRLGRLPSLAAPSPSSTEA